MPIPRTHFQERLSDAYVRAVVARAGYQYLPPEGTEYGVDGYIQEIQWFDEKDFVTTGFMIQVQVKASVTCEWKDGSVAYDMKSEAYNRFLRGNGGPTPRILIIFALPEIEEDWVNISEDELLLRRCCYWTRLTGLPTANVSTHRIHLPRSQVFSPASVQHMFAQLRLGQW